MSHHSPEPATVHIVMILIKKKQKAFFLPLVTMNGHISGHYSALWGQSGESYNEGDAFAVLFV